MLVVKKHVLPFLVIIVCLGMVTYAISLLPGQQDPDLLEHTINQEESYSEYSEDINKEFDFEVHLPDPAEEGINVEQALLQRRSVRNYADRPLGVRQIGQLLWAAAGITDEEKGFRTTPSAGATYPLEFYVVSGNIDELPSGVFKYNNEDHALYPVDDEDIRTDLFQAALRQAPVKQAPALIIVSGVYERTTSRYGERGIRYVHMEAGHAAQNIYLQAESLGLGMVVIGAFDEDEVGEIVKMPDEEEPLYLIPVGYPGAD